MGFIVVEQLEDLLCIELRDLDQKRPKGAAAKNYLEDSRVWYKYPNVPSRYGVLTAQNKIIVVDIDYPDKLHYSKLPPTFTVETGGGGYHLYYYNVDDIESNHRPDWGELKANGHVCGVGTTHPSGNKYTVAEDLSITALEPEEITDLIDSSIKDSSEKSDNSGRRLHTTHVSSGELSFINSRRKRRKIKAILEDSTAAHNDRCYLVGFLSHIGLTKREIEDIIHRLNRWEDYDRWVTKRQVKSVLQSSRGGDK